MGQPDPAESRGETIDDPFIYNAEGRRDAESPIPLAFDTGWMLPATIGGLCLLGIYPLTNSAAAAALPCFAGIAASAYLLLRKFVRRRRYASRRASAGFAKAAERQIYRSRPQTKRDRIMVGLSFVVGGLGLLSVAIERLGILR